MREQELLNNILAKMPNHFSSNQFSRTGKKMGLSKISITNGIISLFLNATCERGDTLRTWYKIKEEPRYSIPVANRTELTLVECIEFLKAHGYKVLKPVSNWEEV